jgi:hypothetical protein
MMLLLGVILYAINLRTTVSGKVPDDLYLKQILNTRNHFEFPYLPLASPTCGVAGGFPAGLIQDYAFTDVPMSYTPSPRIEGLSFLLMITNDPRPNLLL